MRPGTPALTGALATFTLALMTGYPGSAWACPACAQASAGDGSALWAVGFFMLVPFAIAGAAVWALRGLVVSRPAPREDFEST